MKYIRTKDGIIKLEFIYYYLNDMHKFLIVPNRSPVRKDKIKYYFKKHKILKQANTIEELCDEFVYVGEKGNVILGMSYMQIEDVKKYNVNNNKIYGAIWTDKGLIYVAKMNEKGELELL